MCTSSYVFERERERRRGGGGNKKGRAVSWGTRVTRHYPKRRGCTHADEATTAGGPKYQDKKVRASEVDKNTFFVEKKGDKRLMRAEQVTRGGGANFNSIVPEA